MLSALCASYPNLSMPHTISQRLLEIIDALPLKQGIRVLEIGCGTGVAAREIVNRIENSYVLAIDRSQKAIEQAIKSSQSEIKSGNLRFIQSDVETFELPDDEPKLDMAFAIRVGALDGRHPELEKQSLRKIASALKKNAKLYIDGGNPVIEKNLTE